MTCPRNGVINYPRKIVRSRQGQAVITRAARTGSPLTSLLVANGTKNLQVLQSQNAKDVSLILNLL